MHVIPSGDPDAWDPCLWVCFVCATILCVDNADIPLNFPRFGLARRVEQYRARLGPMVEAMHESMYGQSLEASVMKFDLSKFPYLSVRCPSLEHQQRAAGLAVGFVALSEHAL